MLAGLSFDARTVSLAHSQLAGESDNRMFALDHRRLTFAWDLPIFPVGGHHPAPFQFGATGSGMTMSLPSPDGSTSSILSSEDSSSATSTPRSLGASAKHTTPVSIAHASSPCGPIGPRVAKICGVCGDRAKSYHFGGISCDSCKAFFRRSVQNDAYKNFHCPYEGQCDINISSRKCCQFCRFKKCLSIGMEKSWVMTEEERLQMLKTRLEKRQKQEIEVVPAAASPSKLQRLRAHHEPDVNSIGNYLSQRDVNTIERLINEYLGSCNEVPFKEELRSLTAAAAGTRSRSQILDMFFTSIQQLALFAQRVHLFTAVEPGDQQILLRGAVLEMCFIWSGYLFDVRISAWPDARLCRCSTDAGLPFLAADDLRPLIKGDLFEKHMNFIKSFKDLDVDEVSVMLLSVIVLLTSDRPGLSDAVSQVVSTEQDRYLMLLKNYMSWRYGERASAHMYPKLLLKLPDLRELSEKLTDYQLLLCRSEVEQVHTRLANLKLDTSPSRAADQTQWSLHRDACPVSASSSSGTSSFCPETDELSASSTELHSD